MINDYFNFKVPYLNGWLYKKDYEKWNVNRAKISNDIFSNTERTWILDIFDTYNFLQIYFSLNLCRLIHK